METPRTWRDHAVTTVGLLLLLSVLLMARQAAKRKLPEAAGPVFVAETANGKTVRGGLSKLGADWAVELGKSGRVAAGELVSLRREGVALPPLPADQHLLLTIGDRVPFEGLRLDGEKLFFHHRDLNGGKEISVSLSSVALIWRMAPDRALVPEKVRRQLAAGTRARDVVRLRNGDTVEGTLSALKGGGVEVELDKKTTSVKWAQVAVVALSTDLADKARPKGATARVALLATDNSPGGRLTLVSATCDGETLSGKTAFGAALSVPVERVAALDIVGGKAVYLSGLKPKGYEYRPYLDEKWSWSAASTVTGRDLRLGGSTYDEGVGMHASSTLSYDLGGAYRRFEAVVGLDDLEGRAGRVRVRVLVDGKAADLGKTNVLSREGGPITLRVPVEGAKSLALEVEALEDGPVQGVVNWADARVVKKQQN
jgi:NPCBM/NEW2 domain